METLALLSFHKQIDPTTFDSWRFIDYQIWYNKFLKTADEHNKKQTDEQENSKIEQSNAMKSARSNAHKAIPKTSIKIPKTSMKMPKMK